MSGHNKWSTIKHRKGAQDAKRSKVFTKLIKEITIAARMGGGDPDGNPRLRRALDEARGQNMPGDNIQRAIKKGTGELEGVNYEDLLYEGVGPGGVLFLMNVLTDNRNRTAAEVRKIFDKHNGQLGASGSAAWAFEERGVLRLPKECIAEDTLFELLASVGGEDLEARGDEWVVLTPRAELDAVRAALADEHDLPVISAQLAHLPKNPKEVSGDEAHVLLDLFDTLEDHDDVQAVFSDFDVSEEIMAQLMNDD